MMNPQHYLKSRVEMAAEWTYRDRPTMTSWNSILIPQVSGVLHENFKDYS